MQRLLTQTGDDGSHLILGVQEFPEGPRLMFQHEGHGEPELLPDGPLQVRYVTIGGRRRMVVFGDDNDEPQAVAVRVNTGYQVGGGGRLRKAGGYHRRVWMSSPEPHMPGEEFKPGSVTAQWVGENPNHILHEEITPWLDWGTPWPPDDASRLKSNNARGGMEQLLVQELEDGSHLILGLEYVYEEFPVPEEERLAIERAGGEAPEVYGGWHLELMFQHEGHGEPEQLPMRGGMCVRYVMVSDERRVVFCGYGHDQPGVDRVVLDTPYAVGTTCPLQRAPGSRWHPVWMHSEPFRPGPVRFSMMTEGSAEIRYRETTPPLAWGEVWPTEEHQLAFARGEAGSPNRMI